MDDMWAKRKWAQKLRKEGKERKRYKGTRLKELGRQQMRKRIGEERRKWNWIIEK